MNRARLPVRHRRYSLPSTSSLSPFGCLSVPEGSDTFQKALEDLYTNEPNHAPSQNANGFALNGLNNIVEGNESDYSEPESDTAEQNKSVKMSRRHSSPSFLSKVDSDGHFKSSASVKKLHDTFIKSHNQYRKDYFVKHGHWPTANSNKPTPRKVTRPKSFYEPSSKGQDGSFKTSSTALASQMSKLRV